MNAIKITILLTSLFIISNDIKAEEIQEEEIRKEKIEKYKVKNSNKELNDSIKRLSKKILEKLDLKNEVFYTKIQKKITKDINKIIEDSFYKI